MYPFLSISTTVSISTGSWSVLTVVLRMEDIYLLFSLTAVIAPSLTGIGAGLALVPIMGEVSVGLVDNMPCHWFLVFTFCVSSDSGKKLLTKNNFPCKRSWSKLFWVVNLQSCGDSGMLVRWSGPCRHCWWLPRNLGCLWLILWCDWSFWWWREGIIANWESRCR